MLLKLLVQVICRKRTKLQSLFLLSEAVILFSFVSFTKLIVFNNIFIQKIEFAKFYKIQKIIFNKNSSKILLKFI